MPYGNYGMQPSNNLWVGNNYSSGYSQASRSNMGMNGMMNPQMNLPNLMQQPQTINNVLQVMGPESAREYRVGPNSRVILMDMNQPVFYMKCSDDSGYSETKAYEFHEVSMNPQQDIIQAKAQTVQENACEYVTKQDFDEFKKIIEDLVMNNG